MRRLTISSVALLLIATSGAATAQGSTRCAGIADPTARLMCYDREAAPPARPAPAQASPVRRAAEPAWDPATIGKDHVPVPPEDRAFDPAAQTAPVRHLGEVTPPLRRLGPVPVTSFPGSGVPRVAIDADGLRAIPGDRWQLTLTVANNSPDVLDVRVACAFLNGARPVADTEIVLREVRPGERVAADFGGPPVTSFVDTAPCRVLSPLR